jgi:mannose-1-phosphate guanylyltransferase
MIVIDTGEILLIVPKEKSQDVKKIVERLKEEGKQEYL